MTQEDLAALARCSRANQEEIKRDPKRIDRMITKVYHLWNRYPDWRLGQLIYNAMRTGSKASPEPNVFLHEDDRTEDGLDELSEQMRLSQ